MKPIEYEEDVAPVWVELLSACINHGASNFAWHMAERGCSPAVVHDMAQRWREEEFAPPSFADDIEAFAATVEGMLEGAERAWPR